MGFADHNLIYLSESERRRALEEALAKIRKDATPPAKEATKPEEPSPAEVAKAVGKLNEYRRALGLLPCGTTADVDATALAEDVVTEWHNSSAPRREFGELAIYAAFRRGIADGTIKGFDADGKKLERRDPVACAILDSDAEDRAAGVDPRLPIEKRAEMVWNVTPTLRAEFEKMGGFDSYLEWRRRAERSRRR